MSRLSSSTQYLAPSRQICSVPNVSTHTITLETIHHHNMGSRSLGAFAISPFTLTVSPKSEFRSSLSHLGPSSFYPVASQPQARTLSSASSACSIASLSTRPSIPSERRGLTTTHTQAHELLDISVFFDASWRKNRLLTARHQHAPQVIPCPPHGVSAAIAEGQCGVEETIVPIPIPPALSAAVRRANGRTSSLPVLAEDEDESTVTAKSDFSQRRPSEFKRCHTLDSPSSTLRTAGPGHDVDKNDTLKSDPQAPQCRAPRSALGSSQRGEHRVMPFAHIAWISRDIFPFVPSYPDTTAAGALPLVRQCS
ncbi:hypothetical protein EW146_g9512 [Bondarzewia mesenterica]|uniref:Uncharacterized protein n=1 Tax=Bondarzewia mesenterica TaxID=1095465 RepID=A0A4S4L5M1_9AGAM|nr:hypothetical protein EW146_g9512 [Bondarzewia mesenterica]